MCLRTCIVLSLAAVFSMACDSRVSENRKATAPAAVESASPAEPQHGGGQSVASRGTLPQFSLERAAPARGGGGGGHADSITDDASAVSLSAIATAYAATEPIDRKIIRNGELTLETESPTEGLRKITAAAESHGGFVVTSEFKQNPVAAGGKPNQSVTVVARVPASQFASALEQIRGAGERVVQEKVNGQDVSEEYLDVEARLRNKKALEGQFLEIMSNAQLVGNVFRLRNARLSCDTYW